MTDEEFAAGVDAIISTGLIGHASHRALDMWWTRYAEERGGALAEATRKWMAVIEGDHDLHNPYPLGVKVRWRAWTTAEIKRAKDGRARGLTYQQVGDEVGRTGYAVKRTLERYRDAA